jgi:predicted helicase
MQAADILRECESWEDFQRRLPVLTEKEKGDAFELLVKFVLQIHPLYATKLEKVWLQSEVEFTVREHLGVPLKDYGIDIVARTFDGDYWAVQSKYRSDRNSSLTHEELATFMSLTFGISTRFAFGLVCTTTNRVTTILENNERIGFQKADFWAGLDDEIFTQIRARLAKQTVALTPKVPRDDQRDVIAAAVLHFVDGGESRGKFISPCGSGKTLTAWWIAEALNARRIIVAVPSLFLVGQILNVWLREALASKLPINWLCICSDKSIGDETEDETVTHIHDLGVPVIDPAKIFAEVKRLNAAHQIIVTTYQSAPSLTVALKAAGWQCDLAVFDEAHKTVSATVSTKRGLYTHLLFDENLTIPRRVFMTATERRFKISSDEVVSMDNPKLYGKTFWLLSFKEALALKILCDYEVLTIGVRASEIDKLIADHRFISLNRGNFSPLAANDFACLVALRRAVETYQIAHAVSFHSRVQWAQEFRDLSQEFNGTFPELPPIRSFHVTGKMASSERDAILRQFRVYSPSLVTNARCLTEGVDIPEIDCVMFVDPKSSTVDIVQAAGRAMRRFDGKIKSYIVLPFVVRDGVSIDEAASSAGFDLVVTILRALASQDERIVDELRAIYRGAKTKTGGILNFDLSAIVPTHVEAEKFIESIELKCWDKLRSIAYMPYEEATALVQNLGIKTQKQFRAWRRGEISDLPKAPEDLPGSPDFSYAGRGWNSWGEFFKSGYVWGKYRKWLPFNEAREFARRLELKSPNEWEAYRVGRLPGKPKMPPKMPSRPDLSYPDEWIGWHDFLGYSKKLDRDWWPFQQARAWVHKLELWRYRPQGGGLISWKEYCSGRIPNLPRRPQDNIPTAPDQIYAESGWKGWKDWAGSPQTKQFSS